MSHEFLDYLFLRSSYLRPYTATRPRASHPVRPNAHCIRERVHTMPNIVRISHFDVNVGRILGEGGFGKVYRAKDVSEETPVECAAKQMQLNNDTRPAMEREVQFMKTVGDHPSIIGFKECVSFGSDAELPIAKNTTWIFMEMATGGELFDRLIDSGNLTEREPLPASPSLPRPLASPA